MPKFREWTDVNVELPGPGVPVLIWAGEQFRTDHKCVYHAEWYPAGWLASGIGWIGASSSGHECENNFDSESVTHWMPLPEGPNV